MSTLEETFDQKDILEKYNNKAINLIEKGKNIQPHFEMKRENLEKEVEEIRDITFIIDRPQYELALVEVIKALERLANMDLGNTPAKQMENIVKVILAICTDCHTKIQNLHDTMARYIHELLVLGYKLEITDGHSRKLEEEKQKLGSEVEDLKTQLIRTNEFMNKQITDGPKKGSEMIKQILELEGKVKTLEDGTVVLDRKLREMWESKESHKMKELEGYTNLNDTLKKVNEEREKYNEEREKDTVIKQNLLDEAILLTNRLVIAEAEIKEKDEKYDEVMEKHRTDEESIRKV